MFHLRRLQHDRIIGFAFLLHKFLLVVCLSRTTRATCEFLMSHGGKRCRNLEISSSKNCCKWTKRSHLTPKMFWLHLLDMGLEKLSFGEDELSLSSPRWRSWSPPWRGQCPWSRAGWWRSHGAAASCSALCTCSASTGEHQVKPRSSRMEFSSVKSRINECFTSDTRELTFLASRIWGVSGTTW